MADEVITGVFQSYRLRKGDWCVGQLTDRTVITGEFAEQLLAGIEYEFYGRAQDSERFGKQFRVKAFKQRGIATSHGVQEYLRRHCKGIGPVTSDELWLKFGPDAVRVLRTDPHRAAREVKRLRLPVALAASDELKIVAKFEDTHIALTDMFAGRGFSHKLPDDCIRRWRIHAADVLRRDPLKLLVEGFSSCGFHRVFRLYQDLGLPLNRLKLQVVAMWWALKSDSSGSTWLDRQKAIDMLYATMGAGVVLKPEKAIRLGVRARWLSVKKDSEGKVWLAEGEKAMEEWKLAERVKAMREADEGAWLDCSKLEGVTPHQRERAALAVSSSIGILNGGPGVGKSFTLASILKLARRKYGDMMAVCSPTGKAATRLTQAMLACGLEDVQCTTVHRLLKPCRNGHDKSGWGFAHNEENPLPHDVIAVEESSMLSTGLAASLFSALKPGCKVLLIGDARQLPAVDHGKPLQDLIESGVPCGTLTEIKRNSGDGNRVCDDINAGRPYIPSTGSDYKAGQNCWHFERRTSAEQVRALRFIYENLPAEFNPVDDVQVLAIINDSGPISRKPLNEMLQSLLNPHGAKAGDGAHGLRIGDKVVNLENGEMPEVYCGACGDKSLGSIVEAYGKLNCLRCGCDVGDLDDSFVANGECGKVIDSGGAGVHVLYDWPRRVHRYAGEQVKRLELAYALSVHKFQGSQNKIIVFMLDDSVGAAMVAGRQLALTAMSRYEVLTITVGKRAVMDGWLQRDLLRERRTFLHQLLCTR